MPRRRDPLPDDLGDGPFTFREARAAGLARRRLQRADIVHPHHGVYATVGERDLVDRCAEVAMLLGPHRWFSHVTAARLTGIPLPIPWTEDEPIHVLALPGAEPLHRPGIVGWESAQHPGGVMRAGFPVVSPAAVWAQLSIPGATGIDPETRRRRALDGRWLVASGDFLLTGPRAYGGRARLCTLADLTRVATGHRGKRGAKNLSWALPRLRVGAQSPRESLLRLALVERGLPEPVVQPAIMTAAGILHSDLGYPDHRVLIEYEGDHHRTDRAQWLEDLRRRQLFEDAGYRVIAVGMNEFDDGCYALAQRIRRALRA